MIGNSNDETNFPHELLVTDRQDSSICKAFSNNYRLILNFQRLSYQK